VRSLSYSGSSSDTSDTECGLGVSTTSGSGSEASYNDATDVADDCELAGGYVVDLLQSSAESAWCVSSQHLSPSDCNSSLDNSSPNPAHLISPSRTDGENQLTVCCEIRNTVFELTI
jgi:hypothetical protein